MSRSLVHKERGGYARHREQHVQRPRDETVKGVFGQQVGPRGEIGSARESFLSRVSRPVCPGKRA